MICLRAQNLLSRAGDHRSEKNGQPALERTAGAQGEAARVNIVSGGIMFMQPNLISAPRTVITFVFTSEPR